MRLPWLYRRLFPGPWQLAAVAGIFWVTMSALIGVRDREPRMLLVWLFGAVVWFGIAHVKRLAASRQPALG